MTAACRFIASFSASPKSRARARTAGEPRTRRQRAHEADATAALTGAAHGHNRRRLRGRYRRTRKRRDHAPGQPNERSDTDGRLLLRSSGRRHHDAGGRWGDGSAVREERPGIVKQHDTIAEQAPPLVRMASHRPCGDAIRRQSIRALRTMRACLVPGGRGDFGGASGSIMAPPIAHRMRCHAGGAGRPISHRGPVSPHEAATFLSCGHRGLETSAIWPVFAAAHAEQAARPAGPWGADRAPQRDGRRPAVSCSAHLRPPALERVPWIMGPGLVARSGWTPGRWFPGT